MTYNLKVVISSIYMYWLHYRNHSHVTNIFVLIQTVFTVLVQSSIIMKTLLMFITSQCYTNITLNQILTNILTPHYPYSKSLVNENTCLSIRLNTNAYLLMSLVLWHTRPCRQIVCTARCVTVPTKSKSMHPMLVHVFIFTLMFIYMKYVCIVFLKP